MVEHILANCYPKLAAKARLKFDKVREKHLLLLPEKVVVLNETAASILILCDGSQTVTGLVERVRNSLKASTEDEADVMPDLKTIEEDISDFLQEMADLGWVVVGNHEKKQ